MFPLVRFPLTTPSSDSGGGVFFGVLGECLPFKFRESIDDAIRAESDASFREIDGGDFSVANPTVNRPHGDLTLLGNVPFSEH